MRLVEAGWSAQLGSECLSMVEARTGKNIHEDGRRNSDVGEDKN